MLLPKSGESKAAHISLAMDKLSTGFFILAGLIYFYFILQYFFTQLFYSRYNILFLFLVACSVTVIIFFISNKEERTENLLYCSGFFYYAILLYLIKQLYQKLNSFLIAHKKINDKFSNKGFTYVTYHKGIFDRGNSWDEELANNPSWLDHTLSWLLILLPIIFAFISVVVYRNGN